jgi:hypothetical protein
MTKAKGRNKTNRKAYMAAEQRSEAPGIHGYQRPVSRSEALYDPERDGPLHYTDLTAAVFRDPLPGRSALDRRQAEGGIRSISLAGGAR